MNAGAKEYGDVSFERPTVELIDEIQQELEDVSGWSCVLWMRLEKLKRGIAAGSSAGSI